MLFDFLLFRQKTAYRMRISDWSSGVCSSDLPEGRRRLAERPYLPALLDDHDALRRLPEGSVGRVYVDFMEREGLTAQGLVDESLKFRRGKPSHDDKIGRASCRERVCKYV